MLNWGPFLLKVSFLLFWKVLSFSLLWLLLKGLNLEQFLSIIFFLLDSKALYTSELRSMEKELLIGHSSFDSSKVLFFLVLFLRYSLRVRFLSLRPFDSSKLLIQVLMLIFYLSLMRAFGLFKSIVLRFFWDWVASLFIVWTFFIEVMAGSSSFSFYGLFDLTLLLQMV